MRERIRPRNPCSLLGADRAAGAGAALGAALTGTVFARRTTGLGLVAAASPQRDHPAARPAASPRRTGGRPRRPAHIRVDAVDPALRERITELAARPEGVGCAVRTTLPTGTGYPSIELEVGYLPPIHGHPGGLRAVGRVTEPERRVAFAAGEVRDSGGRLLATASSSLLVCPLGEGRLSR